MGSWHQPNLEACEEILHIALKCPDVKFLLMGSQCEYFRNRKLPANVGLLGIVNEKVKADVFQTVDFALNPMTSGSGTNLKMFEYMASGIPVITTKFGTRGMEEKESFLIAEIEDMPEIIQEFDLTQMEEKCKKGREYVVREYDWKNISVLIRKEIEKNGL